eukprot:TRINITY_DN18413_c0_g1_i1.p2 TRINITY_DN18413_c0_g1~~TRINITY_DN18413_c0_g1_i1.p2  ORF type:complete len:172 (+),score=49.59 TRINITY_DN18413_c0_g1_i1:84-599(+)
MGRLQRVFLTTLLSAAAVTTAGASELKSCLLDKVDAATQLAVNLASCKTYVNKLVKCYEKEAHDFDEAVRGCCVKAEVGRCANLNKQEKRLPDDCVQQRCHKHLSRVFAGSLKGIKLFEKCRDGRRSAEKKSTEATESAANVACAEAVRHWTPLAKQLKASIGQMEAKAEL